MENTWSKQQTAIFDFFARGKGNLVVRARAGTGKTTTILEACGHAPHKDRPEETLAAMARFVARVLDRG